jgi:hypothetical protein
MAGVRAKQKVLVFRDANEGADMMVRVLIEE